MNKSHIIALLIGFVLVLAYYFVTRHVASSTESFVDTPTNTPTTTTTTGTTVASTTPALLTIPRPDKVLMYNQVFDPVSVSGGVFWMADVPTDGSKKFSIRASGGNINATAGLVMSGSTLEGPSSDSFTVNPDYSLGSFAVAFYGKINTLTTLPVTVYTMYAEARLNVPNVIQISIVENTAAPANVFVRFRVGTENVNWSIPKSTIATGQNNLYTFVYDNTTPATPTYTFYIGTATPYTYTPAPSTSSTPPASSTGATSTTPTATPPPPPPPPIILGNTNAKVNESSTLDMNLYAFVYYNSVLAAADQADLLAYFTQEANGISKYMRAADAANAALNDIRRRFTSNLDLCSNSLLMCQSRLNIAELSNVMRNPWQIELDDKNGASASLSDMYKCSPLAVKKFGDTSSNVTSNVATTGNVTTSTSNPFDRINIAYPPALPADLVSAASLGNLRINNPVQPVTTSTTTSSSSNSSSSRPAPTAAATPTQPASGGDAAFWSGLFQFLQNQNGRSTTTTSNTSQTDLNTTYRALANAATTDKTQPGSGANLSSLGLSNANPVALSRSDYSSIFWA